MTRGPIPIPARRRAVARMPRPSLRPAVRPALRALAAAAIMAVAGLVPAEAQARGADKVAAEFRTGWVRDDGSRMAALHLRLAPGWMTYWRVPGEGGLALRMDWSGSENLAGLDKHWPSPRVFVQNGYYNIGYRDELVLPIELTPIDPARPVVFAADITLGVCRDVCIPVDLRLRAELSAPGRPDAVIEAALAQTPRPAQDAGLRSARCGLEPAERNGMRLRAELDLPETGANERVIVELPGQEARVRDLGSLRNGDLLRGEALITPPRRGTLSVNRADIRLTVLSDAGAVQHTGCAAAP